MQLSTQRVAGRSRGQEILGQRLELTLKKRRLLLHGRLREISNLNALHMAEMVESELVILTAMIRIRPKAN